MRRELGSLSILIGLCGCGGGTTAAPDAGSDPADAQIADDSGDSADAGADAGTAPDASTDDAGAAASVHWVTVVEPREITGDIALDFAFQYELAIQGDPFVYSLSLERCTAIAGTPETCELGGLSNLPGTGYVRWGVDPSMYAVGENHYTFRLILEREGTSVDEDLLDVEMNVTSCEACMGGSGTP